MATSWAPNEKYANWSFSTDFGKNRALRFDKIPGGWNSGDPAKDPFSYNSQAEISGGGNPWTMNPALANQLAAGGYRYGEAPSGNGSQFGLFDGSGNMVEGTEDAFASDKDFIKNGAALMAAGYFGGNALANAMGPTALASSGGAIVPEVMAPPLSAGLGAPLAATGAAAIPAAAAATAPAAASSLIPALGGAGPLIESALKAGVGAAAGAGVIGALAPDTPPLPTPTDPAALIDKQAAANKDAFDYSLANSRVNVNTPFGQQAWSRGEDGTWNLNTTLSPDQQKLFDANTQSQLQQAAMLKALTDKVAGTAGQDLDLTGVPGISFGGTSRAYQDTTGGPAFNTFDFDPNSTQVFNPATLDPNAFARSSVGNSQKIATPETMIADRSGGVNQEVAQLLAQMRGMNPGDFSKAAADSVYNQSRRYFDVEQADSRRLLESRLAEQGFVPGTPAYDNALRQQLDTQNRAYADMRDRATQFGFEVGDRNFNNSLGNIQQQLAAVLAGGNFGLGNDQARSAEALGRAQFSAGEEGRRFAEDLNIGNFNRAQDNDIWNRQVGANADARAGADLRFNQQNTVQDNIRRSFVDRMAAEQQQFDNSFRATEANNANIARGNADMRADSTFQNQAIQQAIQLAMLKRGLPMDDLNAFRSGTRPTMPSGEAQYAVPGLAPPDIVGAERDRYGAELDRYNAGVGAQNSFYDSLLGMGGLLFSGGAGGYANSPIAALLRGLGQPPKE